MKAQLSYSHSKSSLSLFYPRLHQQARQLQLMINLELIYLPSVGVPLTFAFSEPLNLLLSSRRPPFPRCCSDLPTVARAPWVPCCRPRLTWNGISPVEGIRSPGAAEGSHLIIALIRDSLPLATLGLCRCEYSTDAWPLMLWLWKPLEMKLPSSFSLIFDSNYYY